MEITLFVIGIVFVFFAIAFYVPKCVDEYEPYKPLNFYITLPALGILSFAGSIFIMSAFENESVPIILSVLFNIILCVVHIVVHARKHGVMFAIINYIVHAILAVIIILTAGAVIWIYLLGLHLFTDMVSGAFSDIFDDRD